MSKGCVFEKQGELNVWSTDNTILVVAFVKKSSLHCWNVQRRHSSHGEPFSHTWWRVDVIWKAIIFFKKRKLEYINVVQLKIGSKGNFLKIAAECGSHLERCGKLWCNAQYPRLESILGDRSLSETRHSTVVHSCLYLFFSYRAHPACRCIMFIYRRSPRSGINFPAGLSGSFKYLPKKKKKKVKSNVSTPEK